jgi:hypothetical protein
MRHVNIIIIGGGPAGLAAAISAGRAAGMGTKGSIILIEGNTECGNKLLLSGKGQCNFSNNLPITDFLLRCGKYANYLKSAYYGFDKDAFIHLLDEAGCQSYARPDGKVFPVSMKASDVRDALLQLAVAAGVSINNQARVVGINKLPEAGFEISLDNGGKLSCDKLIISSGGASYPQTGSDGKALDFAKALGHETIPFRPHLGSVNLRDFKAFSKCAGISMPNIRASFTNKASSFNAEGDLLITHTGFSGPLILDNCHKLSSGTEITICWVQDAESRILEEQKQNPNMEILNALWEIPIPRNLLKTILETKGIELQRIMKRLSFMDVKMLAAGITRSNFTVSRVESLNTSMASAGGVPLSEVNAKTMQSRLCPGLYFAGEILDYALPTGGFNIQIAASTGWLAGASAVKA